MKIIDINLPPGDPGDFFCPFSGEEAMNEMGELGESCIAYIPPVAFADAIIACPQLERFWEEVLLHHEGYAFDEDLTGETTRAALEGYHPPEHQRLVGFRVTTTATEPRNTPEIPDPVYKLSFFYVLDFWCRTERQD